ncbi:hypothetical protein Tco_0921967 [Tanacetum coccineum]|uniref:Uncharacterized protein n=1 Tax=Tanacetum coccineum TaxID=301880 RepID=A0ABQ5CZ46_9ASTR
MFRTLRGATEDVLTSHHLGSCPVLERKLCLKVEPPAEVNPLIHSCGKLWKQWKTFRLLVSQFVSECMIDPCIMCTARPRRAKELWASIETQVQTRRCWYKEIRGSSVFDYKMVIQRAWSVQVQDLQISATLIPLRD